MRIDVRKGNDPQDEAWILGMLLLVLKDLQNGLLAVGGQTAIGRGIFSANDLSQLMENVVWKILLLETC